MNTHRPGHLFHDLREFLAAISSHNVSRATLGKLVTLPKLETLLLFSPAAARKSVVDPAADAALATLERCRYLSNMGNNYSICL